MTTSSGMLRIFSAMFYTLKGNHKHVLNIAGTLLTALFITSCTTTSSIKKPESLLPTPNQDVQTSSVNFNTNHFEFGNHSSSAWVSDKFAGLHIRQFQDDALHFGVEQTHNEGGLDVGLSLKNSVPEPVSKAKQNLTVCSTYITDLSGNGRWWAGPKISVNWQGDEAAKQNGDAWYENYIVEIASSTPNELHDIYMGDYFKGEELPSTILAGSTYRHYKIRFHSWWQFWSIRQDYRVSGTLPIEPIVDVWIENGLPTDRTFDGIKANIETYGEIRGHGHMRMNTTHDLSIPLECH